MSPLASMPMAATQHGGLLLTCSPSIWIDQIEIQVRINQRFMNASSFSEERATKRRDCLPDFDTPLRLPPGTIALRQAQPHGQNRRVETLISPSGSSPTTEPVLDVARSQLGSAISHDHRRQRTRVARYDADLPAWNPENLRHGSIPSDWP